jgi:aminopeptidase-like protein
VLTCIGDEAPFTLKTSRDGNTLADRAARLVLRDRGEGREVAFDASSGSEERQYCSPGFNLPVASMSRSLYGTYPEYHTSLDDKAFVSFAAMAESLECLLQIVHALETNQVWKNTVMFGEPQLGTRNLYPNRSADMLPSGVFRDIKWLLNLADGTRDLLAVAERSGKTVAGLAEAAELLAAAGLIAPAGGHERTRGRDRDGRQLA